MNAANFELAAAGSPIQIDSVDLYLSANDATEEELGKITFFSDVGHKLLPDQWDPHDPIRSGRGRDTTVLTYAIDRIDLLPDLGVGGLDKDAQAGQCYEKRLSYLVEGVK